jgi:hypothetical protein
MSKSVIVLIEQRKLPAAGCTADVKYRIVYASIRNSLRR